MSKLELRSYQTEILDHAKQRSVSARFETGAGKTLVAAELIGIIAARPQGEVKKVIVMIVPTVTLAYQVSTRSAHAMSSQASEMVAKSEHKYVSNRP